LTCYLRIGRKYGYLYFRRDGLLRLSLFRGYDKETTVLQFLHSEQVLCQITKSLTHEHQLSRNSSKQTGPDIMIHQMSTMASVQGDKGCGAFDKLHKASTCCPTISPAGQNRRVIGRLFLDQSSDGNTAANISDLRSRIV